MSTKQALVEKVLAYSKRATYDDKWLQMLVWARQGLALTPDQQALFLGKDISAPESIRRTRQRLQEQGKYLPPAGVQLGRRIKAEVVRTEIHKTPPMDLI